MAAHSLLLAGLLNVLAQHNNFNINITDPDFDVRVKRNAHNDAETPLTMTENGGNDRDFARKNLNLELPMILRDLNSGHDYEKPRNQHYKSKRDTYQHNSYNLPYTSNGNANNDAFSNRNDILNDKNKAPSAQWKTKPNIIVRTYNAIADSLIPATTTPRLHRSSHNNAANTNNDGNPRNDNHLSKPTNTNNGITSNKVNDGFRSKNKHNDVNGNKKSNEKKTTTTEKTNAACLFCYETVCVGNQQKVDGECVDVPLDDYEY